MTEVYQPVSTKNEVEDKTKIDVEEKYAKNDAARRALFGPLSIVIRCIGFDDTFSLFKAETRGRCISWIASPLAIIGMLFLAKTFWINVNSIHHMLSWYWGEMMIIAFLYVQSLASAVFLFYVTQKLFALSYYESWTKCAELAEKYSNETEKEKENGEMEEKKAIGDVENGVTPFRIPPFTRARVIWTLKAFLFFIAASVATSVKYALYNGHNAAANQSSTEPLLDKVYSFEALTSVWTALVTATGLCYYGILHAIMIDTISAFNKDLESSSSSSTLSSRLDSFSIRYQSILGFARLLSSTVGHYATFMTKTATVANFCAMFLSLSFKEEIGGLGHLCTALWTFVAVGPMVIILLKPAAVQSELNKTNEILVADKEIWDGDMAIAQKAQMMLTKRDYTDTTVSIFNCLKLTPWVANGLMLVPPIIGGTLTVIKLFV